MALSKRIVAAGERRTRNDILPRLQGTIIQKLRARNSTAETLREKKFTREQIFRFLFWNNNVLYAKTVTRISVFTGANITCQEVSLDSPARVLLLLHYTKLSI